MHLGHELHESGQMDYDVTVKRAQFINKSVEIRNVFHWAAPVDIVKALTTYCSSFYGSMLWDLGGEKASQLYSAWDTAVKLSWGCPRWTRTFLLQQVLTGDESSARVNILSRYSTFARNLRTSISQEVRTLYNLVSRDLRTTTAKNLEFVTRQSEVDVMTVSPAKVKQALHKNLTVEIPEQEEWKIKYLGSLLRQREEAKLYVQEDKLSRLQELIDSLIC